MVKTTDGTSNYVATKTEGSFYLGIGPGGTTANKASFYLNGVSAAWLRGTSDINDNRWHFVVGTWDGSVKRIYVDGVQENSVSRSGTISTGTNAMLIGRKQLLMQLILVALSMK